MKPIQTVQIQLLPLGKTISTPLGTPLHDLLFSHGLEFPCGAHGRCKGCRVRVLNGFLTPTEDDLLKLAPSELEQGWRLACRAHAESHLQLELAQWELPVLADDSSFPFTPQPGLGIAIDLGTTTIVAQLLDLATGNVLAVRTALNAQARHGADVMSRIDFALQDAQHSTLTHLIRNQLGVIIAELLFANGDLTSSLNYIVLVGNTVMHHLFANLDLEPLAHTPFEPSSTQLQSFHADTLGWDIAHNPTVLFLPSLGGFVGSDLLAGILATRLHQSTQLVALMDLGTNGEILLGNSDHILCTSTAAGPAFEGARISHGMRAATGAISAVHALHGRLHCHVIGQSQPRGICGSGLVDAVAAGLDLGLIHPSGRLTPGPTIELLSPITLTQADVRELQLAKAAISAGLHLLLQHWGAQPYDLDRIYLAGAFGNYVSHQSARRIGLLHAPAHLVLPAGNTALLGAKMALFNLHQSNPAYDSLRSRIQHVPLNESSLFQDVYVNEMRFPE